MIPECVTVYNLLLEGHGKDPQAFSHSGMDRWERQVEQAVEELALNHDRIYVVGHSMGTLFAIDQSMKHPKIAGLFLLAVPVKLRLKPRILLRSVKVCLCGVRANDLRELAAKKCYGIKPDPNVLHYIGWIPRIVELFSKIHRTRSLLSHIQTPCNIIFSGLDELISPHSCTCFQGNAAVHTITLPHSGHYYYPSGDREKLLAQFQDFLSEAGV